MRGIYFVGGASGAGKTSATQQLAKRHGVALIELDDLQRMIMPAVPDGEARIPVMREVTQSLIRQLLAAESFCLIDGAWLEPQAASELLAASEALKVVYCGYTHADVDERQRTIRGRGVHWTASLSQEQGREFLTKQVRDSVVLQQHCAALALPYFDFSDFDSGTAALERDFCSWLSR
jgi:gluconate kinase